MKYIPAGRLFGNEIWYSQRRQHPAMYGVASCVLATPVSSSASERVFSALKLIVSDTFSRFWNSTIEDIIVIRSLNQ